MQILLGILFFSGWAIYVAVELTAIRKLLERREDTDED